MTPWGLGPDTEPEAMQSLPVCVPASRSHGHLSTREEMLPPERLVDKQENLHTQMRLVCALHRSHQVSKTRRAGASACPVGRVRGCAHWPRAHRNGWGFDLRSGALSWDQGCRPVRSGLRQAQSGTAARAEARELSILRLRVQDLPEWSGCPQAGACEGHCLPAASHVAHTPGSQNSRAARTSGSS